MVKEALATAAGDSSIASGSADTVRTQLSFEETCVTRLEILEAWLAECVEDAPPKEPLPSSTNTFASQLAPLASPPAAAGMAASSHDAVAHEVPEQKDEIGKVAPIVDEVPAQKDEIGKVAPIVDEVPAQKIEIGKVAPIDDDEVPAQKIHIGKVAPIGDDSDEVPAQKNEIGKVIDIDEARPGKVIPIDDEVPAQKTAIEKVAVIDDDVPDIGKIAVIDDEVPRLPEKKDEIGKADSRSGSTGMEKQNQAAKQSALERTSPKTARDMGSDVRSNAGAKHSPAERLSLHIQALIKPSGSWVPKSNSGCLKASC
eukprot:6396401-Amphidinium_carterae.1